MASLILTTPKGGQRSQGKSPNWGGVWRELWEEMGGPGKPQSGIQLVCTWMWGTPTRDPPFFLTFPEFEKVLLAQQQVPLQAKG